MNYSSGHIQKTKRVLPSLSDNTFLRYFNFIALYFAQGIPEGMLTFGIPAWMAMNGKTPGEIAGFTVVMVLPWSFKFIVAPMMDRYSYLPMGRKRPWVLLGQLGLIISLIFMANVPDPLNNLNQLMIIGFIVSSFGAFQDVATDGMAIDVIPENQQARANGLMWGSKISGVSIALVLGSWLLTKYNFSVAMLSLSGIIALIMLVPIFLRERAGEKITPWSAGMASPETKTMQLENWKMIFKSLYRVFSLKNSLIMALLLFVSQGAFKYLSTLFPIFTVQNLGWTNVEYSQYYASAKLIGGILGMVLGGILIERFGKRKMLNTYFFGMAGTLILFVFSKSYWSDKNFIYSFMIIYNTLYTFACIGIFAFAMQCCWKKVSASQFTLYMTLGNMGQILFAGFIGPIKANFNWEITLLAFVLIIVVAWLILQFINIEKQVEKVAMLESDDAESQEFALSA